MEAAMRPIGVSDEQVRHWDRMERLRRGVVGAAEAASSNEDLRQRREGKLTVHTTLHPGWDALTYKRRVWFWVLFLSVPASLALEPVFTAPVSENLLRSYAHFSQGAASVFKWLGTPMLGVIELGMAGAREKARDEKQTGAVALLTAVALALALTIAGMVGYTQAALDRAARSAQAVQAGLEPSASMVWSPMVILMVLLTLGVHLWVSFAPHIEAFAFVAWSAVRAWLRFWLNSAADAVIQQTRLARNQFATLVGTRDQYAAAYPNSPLPDLRWTNETIRVLREPALDEAEGAPRVLEPPPPVAAGPTAASATPVTPPVQEAARPGAPAAHDESDLLREILARRVSEMDGAVN